MSTGHLRYDKKSDSELYAMLGAGDTPKLYARPVTIDTSHTVPYCGGVSTDGKTVYVDEKFYRDVMSGAIAVKGMSPQQIIRAIIEHEHTEWAVDSGDNPVDVYEAAHEYATAKEEKFVRMLGVDAERYEDALEPALKRCAKRPPTNPPKDLWCGPYLDEGTPEDKEILRQFRAKSVEDAHKLSKVEVGYGIGAERCRDCTHFGTGSAEIQPCELVSGLVRASRHCDRWERKTKGKTNGRR